LILLDRSRFYGRTFGDSRVSYVQDGIEFDAAGNEVTPVVLAESAPVPAALREEVPAFVPEEVPPAAPTSEVRPRLRIRR
jgi:hypothetical protein